MNTSSLKDFSKLIVGGIVNCITNEKFLNAGAIGLIPATGGLSVMIPLIAGLANAVSANVTSNLFEKLTNRDDLIAWLQNEHPDKVNHDLERLIRLASIQALRFLKELFLAEIYTENQVFKNYDERDKKEYRKRMEKFFSKAEKELEDYIPTVRVNKDVIFEPTEYLSKVGDYISLIPGETLSESELTYYRDFYLQHISYCFDLAFKQALKSDNKGYKAFQIWMLENFRSDNQQIKAALKELKEGRDILPFHLIEPELNKISDAICHRMEVFLSDIAQRLRILENELSRVSDLVLENLNATLKNAEKTDVVIEMLQDFGKQQGIYKPSLRERLDNFPYTVGAIFGLEYFTGRQDLLQQLREKLLAGKHIVCINGEAGIGKTTLAAYYWITNRREYERTIWISAVNGIATGLVNLQPYITADLDPSGQPQIADLLHFLQNLSGKNLLVVDNANEENELHQYLQQFRTLVNFDILVTTLCNDTGSLAPVRVTALEASDAASLFHYHYTQNEFQLPEDESALIDLILYAVGYNTLVIEILGKNLREQRYVFDERITTRQLLTELQSKGLLRLKKQGPVSTGYHQLEAAAPEDIINAMYNMAALSDEEVALLSLISLLPSHGTKIKNLLALFQSEEKDHLINTLRGLFRKGWLAINFSESNFKITEVVTQIIRFNNENRIIEDIAKCIDHLVSEWANDFSFAGSDLSTIARSMLLTAGVQTVQMANLAILLAQTDYEANGFGNAESLLYVTKKFLDKIENPPADTYYSLLVLYARVLETTDRLGEASEFYLKAFSSAFENHFEFDYISYAMFFSKIGRFSEAEPIIFRKYMQSLREASVSRDSLASQVVSAHNLAKLLNLQGRYSEALRYHAEALRLQDELDLEYGLVKADRAAVLIRYSNTVVELGDPKEAKKILDAANELVREIYPDDNYITGLVEAMYAKLAALENNPSGWQTHAFKALGILTKRLGLICQQNVSLMMFECENAYNLFLNQRIDADQFKILTAPFLNLMTNQIEEIINRLGAYSWLLQHGLWLCAEINRSLGETEHAAALDDHCNELYRLTESHSRIVTDHFEMLTLDDDEKSLLVFKLKDILPLPSDISLINLKCCQLPFFEDTDLYTIDIETNLYDQRRYIIKSAGNIQVIEYSVNQIRDLGKSKAALTSNNVVDYLQFYWNCTPGYLGFFYIITDPMRLPWRLDIGLTEDYAEKIAGPLQYPEVTSLADGKFLIKTYVLFKDTIFKCRVEVDPDGVASIIENKVCLFFPDGGMLLLDEEDRTNYYEYSDGRRVEDDVDTSGELEPHIRIEYHYKNNRPEIEIKTDYTRAEKITALAGICKIQASSLPALIMVDPLIPVKEFQRRATFFSNLSDGELEQHLVQLVSLAEELLNIRQQTLIFIENMVGSDHQIFEIVLNEYKVFKEITDQVKDLMVG